MSTLVFCVALVFYGEIGAAEHIALTFRDAVKKLEDRVKELENDRSAMKAELHSAKMKEVENGQKLQHLTDMFQAHDTGTIAFAAENTHTVGPNTPRVIIPFGSTILDIGGGYSTSTYTFTAPVNGLYFFQWETISEWNRQSCSYLALNGVAVSGYGSHGNHDHQLRSSGSQTSILILNQGDQVSIRLGEYIECSAVHNSGPRGAHDKGSSFKGFLIRLLQ